MHSKLLYCGLTALIAGVSLAGAPAHAASYDGQWSVVVVTEQGSCDVYRWDLGVAGGKINERGIVAQANGQVDRRGLVNVTFSRGSDQLAATGTLSGLDGSGRWSLPSRQCSGRWKAEKKI